MPEEVPSNVPVAHPNKGFPRKFGRYILEKNLSRGGMGEVYLAVPRGVNRRCVIKTIRGDLTGEKEFVGRFADEAKIMVRMKHESIIRVFDCGRVGGDYYIAMEYLYGRDLGDILDRAYERGEPMPKDVGLHITLRLLQGLDYVHNLKDEGGRPMRLVHRDISPQNVLIGFDGSLKLIDFGLARTELLPGRTQGALAVGKYGYMSPEQARHEQIDGRADLYSTGVMLFEVFTGDRLVDEQDQKTLWARVLSPKHRPPSAVLPDIGEDIDRLIMSAVAVRTEDRFQSAQEMARFVKNKVRTKPCSNERLLQYLRYLYPSADFTEPPMPHFASGIPEPSEKSMIIAMSEEGAKTVFGDGELPVEWTMQIDAASLKALRTSRTPRQESSSPKRRDGATAVIRDEQPRDQSMRRLDESTTGEILIAPSARAEMMDVPPIYHEVHDDAPTAIANPADILEEGTLSDYEDTKFSEPRRHEGRRDSPVTKESPNQDVRPSSHSFGDDEATVMMNMPPRHRDWETADEGASTEFIEATVLQDKKRASIPPPSEKLGAPAPAPAASRRAIEERQSMPPDRNDARHAGRPIPPDLKISEPTSGPNLMVLGIILMLMTVALILAVMLFLN